jgi:hypothetical protein
MFWATTTQAAPFWDENNFLVFQRPETLKWSYQSAPWTDYDHTNGEHV